jgi:hypothetical protein
MLMSLGQPVEIVAVIRRMRGRSQSFLVRGSDGACYVAKFANNPLGNRTLINECLACHLLTALGVSTPDLAILRLGDSCLGREELYFSTNPQESIVNGLHLGSKCPVNPETVAIFDFLPRPLYPRVANLDDVGVVFAFDQWVAHADNRQFIFARQPDSMQTAQSRALNGSFFTAWAIDNGMCFGKDWTLTPNALGASPRCCDIYSHCNLEESASRGANLIQSLPSSELCAAHQKIPRDWFSAGDETALDAMLEMLQKRQKDLVAVHEHVAAARELRNLASLGSALAPQKSFAFSETGPRPDEDNRSASCRLPQYEPWVCQAPPPSVS